MAVNTRSDSDIKDMEVIASEELELGTRRSETIDYYYLI